MTRRALLPTTTRLPARARRSGFSLVSAIFLLIVLAGLGVAIVTVTTSQHTSSALDVQGTRAYQAARAGIEWGLYRQLQTTGAGCDGTAASFTPPAPTLAGFTVTVICTPAQYPHATPPIPVLQIQSTACNRPAADGSCPGISGGTYYVERQLQVTLEPREP